MSGRSGLRGLLAGVPPVSPELRLLTLAELAGGGDALCAAMRGRCHSVPLGEHTVLCRAYGRHKLLVDSRDLTLAPHLMLDGFWEPWTASFLARRLRPGQVAWDVGAGLGCLSVVMADAVGPRGRVLAFEPNPRLAELATRNLALNGMAGWSEVRRVAAAARARGAARFRAELADSKAGRIVQPGDPDPENEAEILEVAVPATRLDEVETERLDLVKVDVEGGGDAVWAGMSGLLDRYPGVTVLLEFHAARLREPARLLAEIADRFALREVRSDGRVGAVEANELFDRREGAMLMLTKGEALR